MAFSFANVASEAAAVSGSAQSGSQIHDGEELKEIQTGKLGFKTLNGDVKVRLLPSIWPSDAPPIPSAQLLSVASSQSILAAADPETLIIASTDEIRQVLSAKEGDNARDIKPILTVPHSRLTHVAFTSDESVLVVFGPSTDGIVAYQVDKLKNGQNEVALHINTRSLLRSLVPNPNPQAAHLVAIVSTDGQLSIADLSTGQLVAGPDGTTLVKDVSCVAWSNRGKQLVAGHASGTAIQLKPDGKVAAHIPKSTSVIEDSHISTISWLEDDTFFISYTPNSTSTEAGIPPSEYYIVERKNKTNFMFHKFPIEVVAPFGVERLPTSHFVTRLRKFDPHITDLLVVAATSATDIGIVSKSTQPLNTSDNPDELVTNEYTLTTLEDDTRRAALPLSTTDYLDTSPIGMAIDLSSKEPVINPLPSDPEIQETVGPVPNLLVLNNEGLLSSWWVIYSDSIKEKITYSGFDSLKQTEEIRSAASPPTDMGSSVQSPEPNTAPDETASSVGTPMTQSTTATPTMASSSSMFGGSGTPSAFGAPKLQPSWSSFGTGSAFGSASKIGEDKPSWTSTGFSSNNASPASSTFGQPGFGKTAFGAPSAIGSGGGPTFGTASTFGKSSNLGQSASTFGQAGFGSGSGASPFASAGTSKNSSGFASFANSGGFAAGVGQKEDKPESLFAKPVAPSGFASFASGGGFGSTSGKQDQGQSPFAKAPSSNTFGTNASSTFFGNGQGFGGIGSTTKNDNQSSFGVGQPFKLQSSFKGDGTAKDDLPAPAGGSDAFGLGRLLNEAKKGVAPTHNVEAEMDESDDQASDSAPVQPKPLTGFSFNQQKPSNEVPKQFITPPSTITQPKTTPAAPVSQLFGPPQPQQTTPQPTSTGFSFTSTTPKDTPAPSHTLFGTKPYNTTTPAFVQKSEPVKSFDASTVFQKEGIKPKADLKKGQNEGAANQVKNEEETVNLKSIPEAPLPPDPTVTSSPVTDDSAFSSPNAKKSKEPDDAPLPPDFLPANRSVTKPGPAVDLPDDEEDADEEDEFSSDFEDSGEDVTHDMSPTEEVEGDHDDDATTEQIQTSPESSSKGANTTSPTGGLFTNVSTHDSLRPTRPLFGEVGRSAPIFPPPKPQQSPRSPSPVRPFATHDVLRPENRSVSAPLHARSAIEQRKAEYSQSAIAAQAARAREEEALREKARLAAAKSSAEKAKAEELRSLEDDEDERIHKELALPVQPSDTLDEFITYQAGPQIESNKTDIPAQIERLYQDINSMICTMGINARSLSAFIMHQKNQAPNSNWPAVLNSAAPMDAMDESWSLNDIDRLRGSTSVLLQNLEKAQIQAVRQKLESCQHLLTNELFELRTKVTGIRKSVHARAHGPSASAPLSAEQASIQHDLRKASALAQTKLVQIEDTLVVMRTKLAEVASQVDVNTFSGAASSSSIHRKPTVEAVQNTVVKMTSMAERKSADIDVLEAQLKKLDAALGTSVNGSGQSAGFSTPRRLRTSRMGGTPGSAASSTFYTPGSQVEASARSTRSTVGQNISTMKVAPEDRDRWQLKALRKQEVATALRTALQEKRKKMLAST